MRVLANGKLLNLYNLGGFGESLKGPVLLAIQSSRPNFNGSNLEIPPFRAHYVRAHHPNGRFGECVPAYLHLPNVATISAHTKS